MNCLEEMRPPTRQCVIKNCPNGKLESKTPGVVNYFRFPTEAKLLKKWKERCNLKDLSLVKSGRICSLHFREKDFDRSIIVGRKMLKENAVPLLKLNLPEEPSQSNQQPRNNQTQPNTSDKNCSEAMVDSTTLKNTEILQNKIKQEKGTEDDQTLTSVPPASNISVKMESVENDKNLVDQTIEMPIVQPPANVTTEMESVANNVNQVEEMPIDENFHESEIEVSSQFDEPSVDPLLETIQPDSGENTIKSLDMPMIDSDVVENGSTANESKNDSLSSNEANISVVDENLVENICSELNESKSAYCENSQNKTSPEKADSSNQISSVEEIANDENAIIEEIEKNLPDEIKLQGMEGSPSEFDASNNSSVVETNKLKRTSPAPDIAVKRQKMSDEQANKQTKQNANCVPQVIKTTVPNKPMPGAANNFNKLKINTTRIKVVTRINDDSKMKSPATPQNKFASQQNNILAKALLINKSENNCVKKIITSQQSTNHTVNNQIKRVIGPNGKVTLTTQAKKVVVTPPNVMATTPTIKKINVPKPPVNNGIKPLITNPLSVNAVDKINASAEGDMIPKTKYDELLRKYEVLTRDKRNAEMFSSQIIETMKKTLEKKQDEIQIMKMNQEEFVLQLKKIELVLTKILTPNQKKLLFEGKEDISWTNKEMLMAFAIRFLSRKCYHFLRQKLNYPLPGISIVQNWLSSISTEQCKRLIRTVENCVQDSDDSISDAKFDEILSMTLGVEPEERNENQIHVAPSVSKHSYVPQQAPAVEVQRNFGSQFRVINKQISNAFNNYGNREQQRQLYSNEIENNKMDTDYENDQSEIDNYNQTNGEISRTNEEFMKLVQDATSEETDVNYPSSNVIVLNESNQQINSTKQTETNGPYFISLTSNQSKIKTEIVDDSLSERQQLYESDQFLKGVIGQPYDGRKAIAVPNYQINEMNPEVNCNFGVFPNQSALPAGDPKEHSYALTEEQTPMLY